MKRATISILFISLLITCIGQPPENYYRNAYGKSGTELKSAIFTIINNHTVISYATIWTAFYKTDVAQSGKVWDMYSNCDFTFGTNQCGNYSQICDCYNREHSFPKSWFNDATPMYTDLFHIYATDGRVNGHRDNYPYGECNGATYGLGKLGACTYPGYSGTVFEPLDIYKGDFARTYFYMLTRYMNVCSSWSTPMMSGGNFSNWAGKMLLEWHILDSVSEKETNRNNVIFTDYQKNRNPFIDYPELAEKIFGNDQTPFYPNISIKELSTESFSVYSSSNIIHININTTSKFDVAVFDYLGRKILKVKNNETTDLEIPFSNSAGIYIVQIRTSNGVYNKKCILY